MRRPVRGLPQHQSRRERNDGRCRSKRLAPRSAERGSEQRRDGIGRMFTVGNTCDKLVRLIRKLEHFGMGASVMKILLMGLLLSLGGWQCAQATVMAPMYMDDL